jgi:hypothetical protein
VLKDLIEAGQLTPVIDRTYPLSEALKGHPVPAGGTRPGENRHHHVTLARAEAGLSWTSEDMIKPASR